MPCNAATAGTTQDFPTRGDQQAPPASPRHMYTYEAIVVSQQHSLSKNLPTRWDYGTHTLGTGKAAC